MGIVAFFHGKSFQLLIDLVVHITNFDEIYYVDGLVQERRKSSVIAMELHFSCINPSM